MENAERNLQDPFETRSTGASFSMSGTNNSQNYGSTCTFDQVLSLLVGKGSYNPSAFATSSCEIYREQSKSSSSASRSLSCSSSRSSSRGRSVSTSSTNSLCSAFTFKRKLQISRALAAEKQQREEYLYNMKKAYIDRLKEPWVPSGFVNATQKNKNIVEKAKAKIDKYVQQKAWKKSPWPEYVPPEERNSQNDYVQL